MENFDKVAAENINRRYIELFIALKVLANVCLLGGMNFKS